MAAKIVLLVALLLLPSILKAQDVKPAFSVELKIDKANYEFGEDVKLTATIKNVGGKRDSISPNDREDFTSGNLKMFHNGKPTGCEIIMSNFGRRNNIVFEPNEEYQNEISLNLSCGVPLLGIFSYNNILDTGFYNCFSYLNHTIELGSKNLFYQKIKSNEVYFRVNPPDSTNLRMLTELKDIFDFSREQYIDKAHKLLILQKLDNFVRQNINSYLGDIAFRTSTNYALFDNTYIDEEAELSNFYIENKSNGPHVHSALFIIYYNQFKRSDNKKKSLEKIEEYIIKYAGTKVEAEAKKLIERMLKQKEFNK